MRFPCSCKCTLAIVFYSVIAIWPAVARGQGAGPLIVGSNSHVVAILYESWFGPNAVTFQGTAAMPLLQSGWGCPNSNAPPYCPDDALRFGDDGSYATFDAFMDYAAQLDPIFLFIDQFNEFTPPDEGWNANTDDDIEPANLWGNDLGIVKHQIELYRQQVGAVDPAAVP
ncbi:MAG: hypothetical protein WCA16_12515 [Candidatus Sulfotelmatobacter sp.]